MPHAPSAAALCGWGYDAVARLRRAVGSTLGRVSDMLLTLWALRWCWVGMARGGDDAMSARWRRAIFSNPIRMSAARTHGESGRLLTQGASEMRYYGRVAARWKASRSSPLAR